MRTGDVGQRLRQRHWRGLRLKDLCAVDPAWRAVEIYRLALPRAFAGAEPCVVLRMLVFYGAWGGEKMVARGRRSEWEEGYWNWRGRRSPRCIVERGLCLWMVHERVRALSRPSIIVLHSPTSFLRLIQMPVHMPS